ncbi:MAG: glycosyltransferase family 39 protein [Chloroflexi bacterium]|nr:glycosyltransferase family 39 protein [Chloroflexota bacterium]
MSATTLRTRALPIALLSLFAFLVGLVFSFGVFPALPADLRMTDADYIDAIARNISEGGGMVDGAGDRVIYWDPLYPLLVAALYTVFGPNLWAVQLANTVLHALTVAIAYVIVSRVYPRSRWVPLLAAGAFAVYPHAVWYLPRITLAALNTFLIACFVLSLLLLLESPSWRKGAVSGFILGLSTLTRGVTFLIPLLLIPVFLIEARGKEKMPLALSWLFLVLAMLVTMTPSFLRNYDIAGTFQPVAFKTGLMFLRGDVSVTHDPGFIPSRDFGEVDRASAVKEKEIRKEVEKGRQMTEVEWSLFLQRRAIQSVVEEPGAFLRKVVWQVPRFWVLAYGITKMTLLKISQSVILPLAAVGLWFSLRNRVPMLSLAAFLVYYIGVHVSILALAGYSVPIMPYVLMLAIYGLANLAQKVTTRRRLPAVPAGLPSRKAPSP